jgi:hypothetical protein
MFNLPTKTQLEKIPVLYATEHIPAEHKTIQCHFFLNKCHWFIAEADHVDTMFGFCILNGDLEIAEWGYVSFEDLKSIKIQGLLEVEYDCYWEPKPASEVELIRRAGGIITDPRDEANGGTWTWHTLQN